ncbi:MAG TPA: peptidylprolyl isomerase [Steroidobacteraceae bacterium]|nr:peptidylprolyl isomerase [Steroidobacteraceae bacterium]
MKHLRILCLTAALVALAACQPKSPSVAASASSSTSPTVATVDGTPISRDFYEFYIKGITGKTSSDLTPQQRTLALDNLIRAQLIANQAVKEGLDKQPDTAHLIKMERLNILEQAMSQKVLGDQQPTDDELKAEYDAEVARLPKTEYHARHILVATEPFADKIIQRLKAGEKFSDLAKAESMDSSKTNGGDLGWFTLDHMVKPFADAVAGLKVGEYTQQPVQTQYGWHVIQLLGTRPLTPPPFDQVKQRLVQIVQAKKFQAYTDELMSKAKVETFLDAQTDTETKSAQSGAPTAPAAPAAAPAATSNGGS